jgi:chemotaxis methyl-accepting protein methylase
MKAAAAATVAEAAVMRRLTAAIGVDPSALELGRLRYILRARARVLGLAGAESYAARLAETPGLRGSSRKGGLPVQPDLSAEMDALVDQVVVQETRFFRDATVFTQVRAAIGRAARETDGPIRLLSAPCGPGQEAYSLAAMARLAGLSATRFTVDAFDISTAALAEARAGMYAAAALGHVSAELRTAVGALKDGRWTVHPELRDRVRFERRNLAEVGALPAGAGYHVILCRNLFIYLTAAARVSLAASLAGALSPGGRLFLGTADRVEEVTALFTPMRPASSFAYRLREPVAERPAEVAEAGLGDRPAVRLSRPRVPVSNAAAQQRAQPAETATSAEDLLRLALEHRVRGEFAKAERRCRQALYLAPDRVAAMELLQILWDRNPNLRMRRALRDRILRATRMKESG